MKTKPFIIATALCGLASFARAQDIDSAAPVVVKTVPEAGSKDIPPGEYEVKVTFSKEMADQSWSWGTAWENSDARTLDKPYYEADHKTWVMKVKLEPGKTYGWWLNSQKFHGFQDTQNHPAVPYLLTFKTSEQITQLVTADSPQTAVQAWLSLMDTGAYPQSWETAAGSFHRAITKQDWISLSEKVRQSLGEVISRKEISAQQSATLPGMPDGSYFVEQFATSFAGLTSAVETVTFSLEKDGRWKAVAYLIRPRTPEETAAVAAAQIWLDGIDGGHYAESWTDAAEFFRNAITQDKWVSALQSVRAPLGDLKIRTVDSAVATTSLPGAPDGNYVVMQFHTAFSKMKSATETITFSLEKDSAWRASGYYIK